jgi:glc operon protein GlcG
VDPERALRYVATARRIAAQRGHAVSVAVVDAAGHPVAVVRGSATKWHGPYMASGKARLSAAFQKPSIELLESWESRPLYAMSLTEVLPGGVTLNPGGYPIFDGDVCVGAIGVGGGSPAEDDTVARLTIEAMANEPITPPPTGEERP